MRVLTLRYAVLGHKSFCFRLVVTNTYPNFIVYARSTTATTKYLINPQHFTSKPLFSVQKAREPYSWICGKQRLIWNSTILQTSPCQQFTLGTFYVPVCFSWEVWIIRTLCKYFVNVNMIKQSALTYCFCINISVILHYYIPFHLYISTHFIAVS